MSLTNTNTLFQANPISFSDVGTHNIKIVLTTSNEVVYFPFQVIVTNTAPYFTTVPDP